MPSGFTAAVAEGTCTTLRQFARRCSRGMCVNAHVRDYAVDDSPIPRRESDGYLRKSLEEAKAQLAKYEAMTLAEAKISAMAEHKKKLQELERLQIEHDVTRARYETMIAKVEAWQPLNDHKDLKRFMLEQLRQSMEFDCTEPSAWYQVEEQSAAEYRTKKLKHFEEEVAYYEVKLLEEARDIQYVNAWNAALETTIPEE